MALNVGELVATLRLDDAQYRQGLDRAGSRLHQAGSSAVATGKMLTAGVSLPLAGIGAAALKAGGDFQASMNRVGAISGATGGEFTKLSDLTKELGRTTQYSASEAADAMQFLAMAGFKTNDIMAALPGTLDLAAAGQLDLAQAADITSNILSGYGMKAQEMGRVGDVLTKTFTSTNVDLRMLGESFKYVGPVASSAGFAFEETAAAIGMLGNAGIQGSEAGTALRGAIARLLKPTGEVTATLSKLGVTITDSSGHLRPLVDILGQLEHAGASTADMISIFGVEAGPGMQALVSQGSEALRTLTNDLRHAEGTAKKIGGVSMEGFNGQIKALQSAVEGLLIAIAESGLLEWATGLLRALTGLAEGLAKTDSGFLRVATVVGGVAVALGPVVVVVGQLIRVFGSSLAAIGRFATGTARVVGAVGPMVRAIGGATLAVARFSASMAVMAARVIATAVRVAVTVTAQFAAMAARGIATTVAMAARVVAQWAIMAAGAMARAVVMAASWVVAMGPVGWVIAAVVGLVALIIANWDTVVSWTKSAWSAVSGWVSTAWQWIVDAVQAAGRWVVDLVSGAWQSARDAVSNGVSSVVGFVRSLPGKILSALGNLGSLLVDSGRSLLGGLWHGIQSAVGWLKSKVSGVLSSIRNLFPFSPAKEGPFSGTGYTTFSGAALTRDFADSIAAGGVRAVAAARGVAAGVHSALSAPTLPAPARLDYSASPAAGPAGVAVAGGARPVGVEDLREALSGMAFVLDESGGRVLARVVNRVNTANRRR